MNAKKLLFVVNDPCFFLSHRLPLAESARNEGFDVQVATMEGEGSEKIEQLGFVHHVLHLSRSGRNPFKELVAFYSMWQLFHRLRPDLVHLVTIKPVLYGGIAARLVKVPGVVSAISGLGYLFVRRAGLLGSVIRYATLFLYRFAMGHPNQRVIFQNTTDMNALVKAGGVAKTKTLLIRGSGVSLKDYSAKPEPKKGTPVIIMASRLLRDKGVFEFVEAARVFRSLGLKARFWLIGEPDLGNPVSVSYDALQEWQKEGVVECLGFRSDIADLFSQAHVITLPSYYGEGLPKVLIEAAACGRAVVTTDMPGCRDAIESGITGLLVPARDVNKLVESIRCLIENQALRHKMGKAGRILAEKEFKIEKVVEAHISIYKELVLESGSKI